MTRMILVLGSIWLAAFACATPARQAAGPAPLAAETGGATKPPQSAEPICTNERAVGTNITRRVCRTPEQIDREREAAQRKIQEMSRTTQKEFN
jgi:hypothetical protein